MPRRKKRKFAKQKIFPVKGKVLIFADTREADTAVVYALRTMDCIVKTKRLDVADFLLSDRVAVEKKTVDDFLQSLVDGRLFQQLAALCGAYEKPVLLIEGGNSLFLRRAIHPNAIRGAFGAIAVDYRVPILWTSDSEESAAQLFSIAKREQLAEKREVAVRQKRKIESRAAQQEFLLAGLPAVSSILARRLLKHFKSPEKVFSASDKELQKVEGIGKEKAKKIKELLQKKYSP